MFHRRQFRSAFGLTILLVGGVENSADGQTGGPADFLVDQLSIENFEQYMIDLSTIPAFDGSPTPSRHWSRDGNTAALEYIEAKLLSFGYNNVVFDEYSFIDAEFNIYATKMGSVNPTQMYIVSAHMDSINFSDTANAPGFDDDASGTALVLELARVFANTRTDVSIRFCLWNNEETGLNGSEAYVAGHAALQGTLAEPTWLGIIQHDMILYDRAAFPDADVEFQATSAFATEAETLAVHVATAMNRYGSMPAEVGNNMNFTDSKSFQDAAPAISVRENQRVAEIGNGSNPHWHQPTDRRDTFTQADIEFGFNIVKMTAGALAELVNAVPSPLLPPYPHDRRKNRYITFNPDKATNDGNDIAFRIELTELTLGSCSGNGGFCREDRGSEDCKTCSVHGNPCINQPTDCAPSPPQTCDPTGQTCLNDTPDSGGTSVGQSWWVGPESPLGNSVHLMVSESFRKVSTDWLNPTHVGDCEIVPEAAYSVRAVAATVDPVDVETESDFVVILTTGFASINGSWWGDCVGPLKKFCGGDIRTTVCTSDGDCTPPDTCDRAWTLPEGAVNVDDLTAVLWTSAPAPPTTVSAELTWVDLHGNASFTPGSQNFDPPNSLINVSDLQQVISAFNGQPYTFFDPADCPDVDAWP